MKILRSVFFSISLFLSFFVGINKSQGDESNPLMREYGDITIYVAEGPGEPGSLGSYSVRVLDNGPRFYRDGLVNFRNGSVVDWWVVDIERDDKPEIVIWIRSSDSGEAGKLDVYEFDGLKLKLSNIIPKPSNLLLDGYRGADSYEIDDRSIVRRFPIYKKTDPNANPTKGMEEIRYFFDSKEWVRSDKGTIGIR